MRREIFKAQIALLEQRWPWPAESSQAMGEFRAELWAAVVDWEKTRVAAFKRAVQEIVADKQRYGRPSVEGIIQTALSTLNASGQDVRELQMQRGAASKQAYYEAMGADPSVRALREHGYRPSDAIMALPPSDRARVADHVILHGAGKHPARHVHRCMLAAKTGNVMPPIDDTVNPRYTKGSHAPRELERDEEREAIRAESEDQEERSDLAVGAKQAALDYIRRHRRR